METFISRTILSELSYQSTLGRSLKQISLRNTPIEEIIQDIGKYRSSYIDTLLQENLIGSRFKSDDSIYRKYEKTLRNGGGFKQCFNDILGFRLHLKKYPLEYPEYFRVVDLRVGKQVDDGYRAIHLYYQRDSFTYPIEIQLWCENDYQFNVWSHKHIYKYDNAEIGRKMYEWYTVNEIREESKFLKKLLEMRNNEDGR